MKRFIAMMVAIVLCVLSASGLAVEDWVKKKYGTDRWAKRITKEKPDQYCIELPEGGYFDVSYSYGQGTAYTKLQKVINDAKAKKMTPQEYFLAIACSQDGYTGSSGKVTNLDEKFKGTFTGNKVGDNVEYTWDDFPWCASFVSWCARVAGYGKAVMPTGQKAGTWKNQGSYKKLWNANFTKYDTSVDFKPGDLVTFFPSDYKSPKKGEIGRKTLTGYSADKKGIKITHTHTTADNCGKHYLSFEGTSHVAIVKKAEPVKENGKIIGYLITTIERHGHKVGSREFYTHKSGGKGLSTCTHLYPNGPQTIPPIMGRYRPNWAAAKTWDVSGAGSGSGSGSTSGSTDNQKPVLTGISVSNINSTGFDLNLTATDNVGVTKYHVEVLANGTPQYTQTLNASTVSKNSSQKYHFNWSQLNAGMNVNYHVVVYPKDAAGNNGNSRDVWAYADGSGPENVTAYVTNVTKDGYDLVVHAQDSSGIAAVGITIYGANIEQYNNWSNADGSKDYTHVYPFNFRNHYNSFAGDTLYANYIYVKDGNGNTADAIRADVFADASAPAVTAKGFEDENDEGFTARYVVTDNSEIAEINLDLYLDGEYQETYVQSVSGRKTYEGSYRYSYPTEAAGEEHYTAKITVYDAAGNETQAIDFGTSVVRAAPNVLPKDYFRQPGSWEYVIDGDHFYITGPAEPEVCASVTRLVPSDFPTKLSINGVSYDFWGTKMAEDPAHSFAALPNLQEIVGFPATTQEIGGFEGCQKLRKVMVTGYNILENAFKDCPLLSEVRLQMHLSGIEENAFANCPKLTKLLYEGTVQNWRDWVTVDGSIPSVSYWIDVSVSCKTDTQTSKPAVITATFTNNGWLGNATYWKDNDGFCWVDIYDKDGNELGYYASHDKNFSVTGKTCVLHLDLGDMSWSESLGNGLAENTTYQYRVYLYCEDELISSELQRFTTAGSGEAPNPIQYITLNYSGVTLTKGDSLTLYRYLHPGDAKNRDVTWSSSNSSVVSVSNGKITAVKAGTANITCQAVDPLANGAKAVCSVRVTEECSSCSTNYSGWYRVKGTPGNLAISSKHAPSTSEGATELGKLPEGTIVWINKATGYNGQGNSSGKFGHVSYKGVSGFCAMNFLEKINGITVTLNLNGGTTTDSFLQENGQPSLQITLWEGASTNSNVVTRIPVRTGYKFRGWNTNVAGTGKMVYDASGISEVDGDWWKAGDGGAKWPVWGGKSLSTLYAAWEPVQNTIIFDPTGGTIPVFSQTMTYDSTANNTAPIPKKAGYTFLGWYSDGNTMLFGADGKWSSTAGWYFTSDGKWQRDLSLTVRARWALGDTTPPVIRDVYIYGRTAEGYIVSFIAEDDVALTEAYIESWTETEGEANAVRDFAIGEGGKFLGFVNTADHGGETGVPYYTRIIVRDEVGNEDIRMISGENTVYLDAEPPTVLGVRLESVDEYGVFLTAEAEDNEDLSYVRCILWPEGEGHPDENSWYAGYRFELDEEAQWCAYIPIPQNDAAVWHLAVRAEDESQNASPEMVLTVNVTETKPTGTLRYQAYDGHVYFLMTPVSRPVGGTDAKTVWEASEAYCESIGGHLIQINSAEENAFASALAYEYGAPVWIGASKNENWKWVNGSDLSYKNWATAQPDNLEYAALQPDGQWIGGSETADEMYGFICEIDDGVLSLPKVKTVGERAFFGNAAQIVVIPDSCERIESEAFSNAEHLTYVLLPEDGSLDIDEDAFEDVQYLTY